MKTMTRIGSRATALPALCVALLLMDGSGPESGTGLLDRLLTSTFHEWVKLKTGFGFLGMPTLRRSQVSPVVRSFAATRD